MSANSLKPALVWQKESTRPLTPPPPTSPVRIDPDAIAGNIPRRRQPRKTKRPAPLTWTDATCRTLAPWQRHYTLPVSESANRVWRRMGRRIVKTPLGVQNAAEAAARFHGQQLHGELSVVIVWVRKAKQGDTDNRIKATLDLLRGVAYADDAGVADLRIVRVDDPTEAARMELLVTRLARSPALSDFPFCLPIAKAA